MLDILWMAMALVLVIEGLFPFLAPSAWRQTFIALLGLRDGQIRFFGLCAIMFGLLVLLLL